MRATELPLASPGSNQLLSSREADCSIHMGRAPNKATTLAFARTQPFNDLEVFETRREGAFSIGLISARTDTPTGLGAGFQNQPSLRTRLARDKLSERNPLLVLSPHLLRKHLYPDSSYLSSSEGPALLALASTVRGSALEADSVRLIYSQKTLPGDIHEGDCKPGAEILESSRASFIRSRSAIFVVQDPQRSSLSLSPCWFSTDGLMAPGNSQWPSLRCHEYPTAEDRQFTTSSITTRGTITGLTFPVSH